MERRKLTIESNNNFGVDDIKGMIIGLCAMVPVVGFLVMQLVNLFAWLSH